MNQNQNLNLNLAQTKSRHSLSLVFGTEGLDLGHRLVSPDTLFNLFRTPDRQAYQPIYLICGLRPIRLSSTSQRLLFLCPQSTVHVPRFTVSTFFVYHPLVSSCLSTRLRARHPAREAVRQFKGTLVCPVLLGTNILCDRGPHDQKQAALAIDCTV